MRVTEPNRMDSSPPFDDSQQKGASAVNADKHKTGTDGCSEYELKKAPPPKS